MDEAIHGVLYGPFHFANLVAGTDFHDWQKGVSSHWIVVSGGRKGGEDPREDHQSLDHTL